MYTCRLVFLVHRLAEDGHVTLHLKCDAARAYPLYGLYRATFFQNHWPCYRYQLIHVLHLHVICAASRNPYDCSDSYARISVCTATFFFFRPDIMRYLIYRGNINGSFAYYICIDINSKCYIPMNTNKIQFLEILCLNCLTLAQGEERNFHD